MVFVDGENLVMRYQHMCESGDRPNEVASITHEKDVFVWSKQITAVKTLSVRRVSYYTSVVGDSDKVDEVRRKLAAISYAYGLGTTEGGSQFIHPRVFKKASKGRKTRSVDIGITIDVMRHALNGDIDIVYLLSGDGDYLPLIEEVMRHGVQVIVAAFSSGLAAPLRFTCDHFVNLDDMFFAPNPNRLKC